MQPLPLLKLLYQLLKVEVNLSWGLVLETLGGGGEEGGGEKWTENEAKRFWSADVTEVKGRQTAEAPHLLEYSCLHLLQPRLARAPGELQSLATHLPLLHQHTHHSTRDTHIIHIHIPGRQMRGLFYLVPVEGNKELVHHSHGHSRLLCHYIPSLGGRDGREEGREEVENGTEGENRL